MAEITKKDIFDSLNDFYGKGIEPRFDRIEKKLDEHDQKFQFGNLLAENFPCDIHETGLVGVNPRKRSF